ncbi:MAG: hypothetical protein B5M56_07200 [Desulfococcus sp. 4484_241]|nr:MAG: hypothetical protein B5M56_07200 [Desulfococcus sp. 4484_241]
MKCEKCGANISEDEIREVYGQKVCEDCYLDITAKPKVCDPWAVYSAKNLSGSNLELNDNQSAIVEYLKKNGPTPPEKLFLDLGISADDLEREIAALRHMEKVRAQLRDGRKVICLWDQVK